MKIDFILANSASSFVIVQMHTRILIMEANTMNPDQTALIYVHSVCNISYQS